MTDAEKHSFVAHHLREHSALEGPRLALRAQMVIVAEHFDSLAIAAKKKQASALP